MSAPLLGRGAVDHANREPMPSVPYAKMNGIGNAILVVDLRGTDAALDGASARALAATSRFGFDQLMAIGSPRGSGSAPFVDIYNNDGSPAGACGNGARCVAWVLGQTGAAADQAFDTRAGRLTSRRLDPTTFSIDMGAARLGWEDIPLAHAVTDTGRVALASPPAPAFAVCAAVSMGNPHAVFFVPDATAVPLAEMGAAIERDPVFPDRANVSFAEIRARDDILLRVWERGAGATLACGSAACATVVAAVRAGLSERTAHVHLPGGDLRITWEADGHVVMTGGVELEHQGMLSLPVAEPAA